MNIHQMILRKRQRIALPEAWVTAHAKHHVYYQLHVKHAIHEEVSTSEI